MRLHLHKPASLERQASPQLEEELQARGQQSLAPPTMTPGHLCQQLLRLRIQPEQVRENGHLLPWMASLRLVCAAGNHSLLTAFPMHLCKSESCHNDDTPSLPVSMQAAI